MDERNGGGTQLHGRQVGVRERGENATTFLVDLGVPQDPIWITKMTSDGFSAPGGDGSDRQHFAYFTVCLSPLRN